jgi:hypothetical protein
VAEALLAADTGSRGFGRTRPGRSKGLERVVVDTTVQPEAKASCRAVVKFVAS